MLLDVFFIDARPEVSTPQPPVLVKTKQPIKITLPEDDDRNRTEALVGVLQDICHKDKL